MGSAPKQGVNASVAAARRRREKRLVFIPREHERDFPLCPSEPDEPTRAERFCGVPHQGASGRRDGSVFHRIRPSPPPEFLSPAKSSVALMALIADRDTRGGGRRKSEVRSPKSEVRRGAWVKEGRKSGDESPQSKRFARSFAGQMATSRMTDWLPNCFLRISCFGLRTSFGLRISDLGSRPPDSGLIRSRECPGKPLNLARPYCKSATR
jgi:hypothetical protein